MPKRGNGGSGPGPIYNILVKNYDKEIIQINKG
jgi:hypothetical protein